MSNAFISRRSIKVEWGDCDPARIVFFPNFFRWFDASTDNHFGAAGLPKPELIRRFNVVGVPMVDTSAKFHIPAEHGDDLVIETAITRFGTSSFNVEHKLLRQGKLAVEGFEKRVLVSRTEDGGITSCPIPEQVKALFLRDGAD